jgi:xanthine dehydrogenase large subunit
MGGGFGGKETQANAFACLAALAASLTGRPARLRLDRDDDMTITGKRHDFAIDYTVGFDNDGMVHGVDMVLAAGHCRSGADYGRDCLCDRAGPAGCAPAQYV